jgi:hypothetical protein
MSTTKFGRRSFLSGLLSGLAAIPFLGGRGLKIEDGLDVQIRHIPAETPTWQCGRCRRRFRAAPTGEVLCPECGKQMIAFEGLGPR